MSDPPTLPTFTAFAGAERVVRGTLEETLREAKRRLDADPELRLLIFEDASGKQVDFDFRGTLDQVLSRARPERPARAGPGRPKLGVVSREVSLLPRHWEWLERQPQGISAALRRRWWRSQRSAPRTRTAPGRRAPRPAASCGSWPATCPLFEEGVARALRVGQAALHRSSRAPGPRTCEST